MYMYVFSVIHKARGDTQASAWSRALTTARSRAYCAITSMASYAPINVTPHPPPVGGIVGERRDFTCRVSPWGGTFD